MMTVSRPPWFLFIGFGSSVTQIILFREFFAGFYGNELVVGIVFSSWLFWVGMGSLSGVYLGRLAGDPRKLLTGLSLMAPLMSVVQVICLKFSRLVVANPVGEYASLGETALVAWIVLSPACFLWGAVFTLGAIHRSPDELRWQGLSRAYIAETTGSIIGGLAFSFVFAGRMPWLTIVMLVQCLGVFCLMKPVCLLGRTKSVFLVLFTAAALAGILLDQEVEKWQWKATNDKVRFVQSRDSKYGRIAALELDGQYSIYLNGVPSYTMPNTYHAELLVHSTFVHVEGPRKVLIIGGGFEGLLKEIAKYRPDSIEYVELDPELLALAIQYTDSSEVPRSGSSCIRIIHADGREFVRNSLTRYDVVLVNAAEPSTAAANRFFTQEFFRECFARLSPSGIVVFPFRSSMEYFGGEMRGLNTSIYRSFRSVFDNTLLMPGSRALLIGSRSAERIESNPDSLSARFVRGGLPTEYFSGQLFDELLSRDRASFVERELLKDPGVQMNTDDTPVAYFYSMALWTRSVQSNTRLVEMVSTLSMTKILGIAGGILLIVLVAAGNKRRQQTAAALIMFLVGFAGIAFSFLLLLNFQVVFGSIFELMGALLAAHMAGIGTGALIVSQWKTGWSERRKLGAVIVLAILFALLLPPLSGWVALTRSPLVSYGAMVVSGIFGGAVFALTNTFSLSHNSTNGAIYAADLIGASLGALLVSSIFLPLWGLTGLSITLAALLAFSLLLLVALRSPGHPLPVHS